MVIDLFCLGIVLSHAPNSHKHIISLHHNTSKEEMAGLVEYASSDEEEEIEKTASVEVFINQTPP